MLAMHLTQPPFLVMSTVAGLALICVGGTAAMKNNPLACLGYSVPIFATGINIAASQTFQSHWVLVFVLVLLGFAVIRILSCGMQPILEIVALVAEPAKLVDDLEEQLKQQDALIASYRVAQADLAESNERNRALALLSSDWYWEQDAEFRFIEDPPRKRTPRSRRARSDAFSQRQSAPIPPARFCGAGPGSAIAKRSARRNSDF